MVINLEPEISNAQTGSFSQPNPSVESTPSISQSNQSYSEQRPSSEQQRQDVNIDAELEQLLAKQSAAIKVVGTGGGEAITPYRGCLK